MVKEAKGNTFLFPEVIQEDIGAEALILHNLSTLSAEDIKENEDYFSLMKSNLETLQKALNNE